MQSCIGFCIKSVITLLIMCPQSMVAGQHGQLGRHAQQRVAMVYKLEHECVIIQSQVTVVKGAVEMLFSRSHAHYEDAVSSQIKMLSTFVVVCCGDTSLNKIERR